MKAIRSMPRAIKRQNKKYRIVEPADEQVSSSDEQKLSFDLEYPPFNMTANISQKRFEFKMDQMNNGELLILLAFMRKKISDIVVASRKMKIGDKQKLTKTWDGKHAHMIEVLNFHIAELSTVVWAEQVKKYAENNPVILPPEKTMERPQDDSDVDLLVVRNDKIIESDNEVL